MLFQRELSARTLTIKVRYSDFSLVTRSHSLINRVRGAEDLYEWLPWLLEKTEAHTRPVRLLGVSVSGLEPISTRDIVQLSLL